MCCTDLCPLTADEREVEVAFWRGYVHAGKLTGEQAYQLAKVLYRHGFHGLQLLPKGCCQ